MLQVRGCYASPPGLRGKSEIASLRLPTHLGSVDAGSSVAEESSAHSEQARHAGHKSKGT